MIPHNQPAITSEDIAAVAGVLRSGWIAQGPEVEGLEEDFTRLYGGGAACACSSGTAALYLALKGGGVEPGDIVGIPTYACTALLNAIYLAGAKPAVADVKPKDFTLDPQSLMARSKAVIAVHTFGAAADISALKELAPFVIEDCCQALGGRKSDGRFIGGDGDVAVFSFYATKIVTCGHGGLVWGAGGRIAKWARDYRDYDSRETYRPRFNFHLTDIQAALVRSQLSRLAEIASRRRAISRKYLAAMPKWLGVQTGLADPGRMVYRFVLLFPERQARDAAMKHLAARDIQAIVPVERYELLHRYLHLDPQDYPQAERLVDTTLSIPLYPALSDDEVERISAALSEIAA